MFSEMLKWALGMGRAYPLRIIVGIIFISGLGSLFWQARQGGFQAAQNQAKEATNHAIQSSGKKADDTELSYDQCIDAGRVWSFTNDKCT